ncbi:hypothetical protein [Pseudomonas putida]|uniref:hypothetical protein n=1 Tax=Pseudomonas putida TaxID=303 RepID=UPI0024E15DD1|nr:hypothetical protein [Pseudomonas putida]HDS0969217.1 hypothetical protein [Pseudomonas putida]
MHCATVGDLRRLLEGVSDETTLYLRIYSEGDPETLRYASDVEKAKLDCDLKFGYQTADGDRDVVRIYLHLDLDPCD